MNGERTRIFAEADVDVKVDSKTVKAKLTAPYAFVPLEDFILPSPLDAIGGADHGRPLPDGLSGEIEVEWRFDQPVLVGGAENATFATLPDRTGQDRHALPGGTLRGLLRSFLEIATCARMTHLDADAHYGVRDITDPHYKTRNPVRNGEMCIEAAWLVNDALRSRPGEIPRRPSPEGWRLVQVVHHELLTAKVLERLKPGTSREEFEKLTVAEKYRLLGSRGRMPAHVRREGDIASLVGSGIPGHLIFTGHDPQRLDHARSKKRCFLFEVPDTEAQAFDLDPMLMHRFIFMHTTISRGASEKSPVGAWDFWLGAWRNDQELPGIPVFLVRPAKMKIKDALSAARAPRRSVFIALAFRQSPAPQLRRRSLAVRSQSADRGHAGFRRGAVRRRAARGQTGGGTANTARAGDQGARVLSSCIAPRLAAPG